MAMSKGERTARNLEAQRMCRARKAGKKEKRRAAKRLNNLLRKAEKTAAAAVAKDAEVAAELAKIHTCAICLDPTSVTLVCGHAMCEECMGRLAVFQGQTLTRSRRRVVIQCPLRCLSLIHI